jgi:hypothetical protein
MKTKIRKPQNEIICNSAETLYRQIKSAWSNASRGGEFEEKYKKLCDMAGDLCDACKTELKADEQDEQETSEHDN